MTEITSKEKARRWLETRRTSHQKCRICMERIPRDVPRISFVIRNQHKHLEANRICGQCLKDLAKHVSYKPLHKWKQKKMIEAL